MRRACHFREGWLVSRSSFPRGKAAHLRPAGYGGQPSLLFSIIARVISGKDGLPPSSFRRAKAAHLRPAGYGGQPSLLFSIIPRVIFGKDGLPAIARSDERRLKARVGIGQISPPLHLQYA